MTRIVCHFSCGAASAVATKLILSTYDSAQVVIYNAFLVEEHPDNQRFMADCARWFKHPITVLWNDKYGASAREVWRRKRFMVNSLWGAPCSSALKREVLDSVCLPGDTHVFGFTTEERKRAQRFLDSGAICPLIDRNLTKADCLAIIDRANIQLPEMYRLGFNNANCIGCPKGGEGYWNHIRAIFPEDFEATAKIQDEIGPNAYFFRNRKTGERFGLRQLPLDVGNHREILPDCSFYCQLAEEDMDK